MVDDSRVSEAAAVMAAMDMSPSSVEAAEKSDGLASGGDHSAISDTEDRELTLDERYALARSVGEECIQDEELRNLLEKKKDPVCYDGFEPSGRMHIAQGVMKALNVNKLTRAGCIFKFWVADWFAQLNHKMGGDLKKIRTVGEYMIEVWKAVGMDQSRVQFLWSSDEINKGAAEYWPLVMDIARRNNLARIVRCSQIMGRNDTDDLSAAQIFYPCMQCADIFFLKADICQLGLDQRKVNVLAREYCTEIKRKNKPIILSHRILCLPNGDVNVKIKKAYCPPQQVEGNPCVEYVKYIVLPWFKKFEVHRSEANGGPIVFHDVEEFMEAYKAGQLHPGDLKPALAKAINIILQPVRDHFTKDPHAKKLLSTIKNYKVTR
ncbi:hypothetical protein CBR_g3647 [Chara braunii]|uniref:tyrosine--tRNA ligase n=1 Tax=Chara braunii TaxID=69332 RepID=A0A388KG02_CHABU|nr:hypothetical protein CBR_g3647 [Chara braunii]|eukprot:GBG68948.1 hypothetical protein CBR_g3647 [Chara braunii]